MAQVTAFMAVPVVSADELDLRRRAIAIAAMLPSDLNDALSVLELAKVLVVDFLGARAAQ